LIFKREALAEIYATHNFKIMNLAELKKHLKNSGLDILFSDYVMGCSFWISADSPKIKPERRWLAEILEKLEKKLLPKLPSLNVYSPMILCIARKN